MIALWQAIVERLLSWPVAVFFLALVFKKPVTEFIASIDLLKWKGGAGEVEFSRKANQQIEAAARTPLDPLALPHGGQQLNLPMPDDIARRRTSVTQYGGDNPLLLNHIEGLKADLQTLQFPLNDSETTELLIRHLAATQLMQRAELIYRLIFGSQMAAMEKMNLYGPQEPTEIIPFFEKAKKRSPRFYGETTFEPWIDFLLKQNVVVFENGRYAITLYGREFLGFVTSQGLAKKPH